MKASMSLSAALAMVAVFALVIPQSAWAEKQTVTGTVSVVQDDDGKPTDVKLKSNEGNTYAIKLDENGKKIGKEMNGKKIQAIGNVTDEDGKKVMVVESYKETEGGDKKDE